MLVDHTGLEAAAARLRRALELVTTIDRAGRELEELTADPADPLAGFTGAGILKRLEVRERPLTDAIDDVARRFNLSTSDAIPPDDDDEDLRTPDERAEDERAELERRRATRCRGRLVDVDEDVRPGVDAPNQEPPAEQVGGAAAAAAEPSEDEAAGPVPPTGPEVSPAPPPHDASSSSSPAAEVPAIDLTQGSPETRTERLLDAVRGWFRDRDRDWYGSGQVARELGIGAAATIRACKALLGAGELEHNGRGGAYSKYRVTDAMVPADDQAAEDAAKTDGVDAGSINGHREDLPPAMQPNPRAGQPGEPDLVAGPGAPAPVVPISRRVQRELEREQRRAAAGQVGGRDLDGIIADPARRRIADAVLRSCADEWRHPAAIASEHVINRQETTYVAGLLHSFGRLERGTGGLYRVPQDVPA